MESVPNPYTISAPYPGKGGYKAGDTLDFGISLFGAACSYESDILSAARQMCNGKLSGSEIVGIKQIYSREWSDSGSESIPRADTLALRFLTPTIMLSSKEPVNEPDFAKFIDSLFGRIAGIIDHYTDSEFVLPYALVASKPLVRISARRGQCFRKHADSIPGASGQ